ncbi:hypothetical protein GH146_02955 [archaeon]|nr:hypothetical protein [archaeon]
MNLEKKKTVFLVCLVVILLVSVFSVRLLLSNERPQGEEYKALAEQLLSDAREEFEDIRGVSVREVTLEVVNQSWVIKNWGVAYIDPEETRVEENIYKALFMISQDVNLTEVQLEWTGMFSAAKWNGKIYVVEEKFDVTNEFKAKSTFVHELTHIMQENYSLPTRTTFDGAKALTSLKEGDATLMADTFKNDGVVPPSAEVSVPSTSGLPESINKINRFVYRYGVEFVKAVYEQGGWDAVDEAYANPPRTTEQIMHPEKYFAQEDALTVEAASVTGDWNLTKTERFGEYFIFVMLDKWISETEAENAAEGWGGDIINYYEKDDDFLFTWNIVWDSKDDANEFYLAFQNLMYKSSAEKHNCSYWSAYGRYISIQWNENSTLILSSANETIVQQQFFG